MIINTMEKKNIRIRFIVGLALLNLSDGFSPNAHFIGRATTFHRRKTSSILLFSNPVDRPIAKIPTQHGFCANETPQQQSAVVLQSSTGIDASFEPKDSIDLKTEEFVEGEVEILNEELASVPLSAQDDFSKVPQVDEKSTTLEGLLKIFYCSCLITSNTAGASIIVLPDAVAEAGVGISAMLFLGVYLLNIITSYYLSDLSIEQYQSGRPEAEVPISFKDIASEAFGSSGGNILSFLSIAFNYCILIFGVIRFGDTATDVLSNIDTISNINPIYSSVGYAGILVTILGTFSNVELSKVTTVLVGIMFPCFLALVVPGLQIADWDTFMKNSGGYFHGTQPKDILASLMAVGPIIVYNMEIQKIVPSVTKLCNFNRFLSRSAIAIGGSIPTLMYLSYVYMNLGSETSMTENQELFLVFKFAALFGAAIAASMSLSEEFESLLGNFSLTNLLESSDLSTKDTEMSQLPVDELKSSEKMEEIMVVENDKPAEGVRYTLRSVLFAITPPLFIGLQLARSGDEGVVAALDFAGGYITPVFIWVFPAMLAWKKIEEQMEQMGDIEKKENNFLTFLGEKMTIATVMIASIGITGIELLKDFGAIS